MKVVIASAYPNVRDALRTYLKTDPSMEIVGETSTLAETVDLLSVLRPDVVLMENTASRVGAAAPGDTLQQIASETAVVYIAAAPPAGMPSPGVHFLGLDVVPRDLFDALWCVGSHRPAAGVCRCLALCGADESEEPNEHRLLPQAQPLSRLESCILSFYAAGETTAAISAKLDIPHQSVEAYRQRIVSRLAADSLPALFAAAAARGTTRR